MIGLQKRVFKNFAISSLALFMFLMVLLVSFFYLEVFLFMKDTIKSDMTVVEKIYLENYDDSAWLKTELEIMSSQIGGRIEVTDTKGRTVLVTDNHYGIGEVSEAALAALERGQVYSDYQFMASDGHRAA
ncbi:MAG: hypothetical protein WCP79_12880 [Bacillota bacterium]